MKYLHKFYRFSSIQRSSSSSSVPLSSSSSAPIDMPRGLGFNAGSHSDVRQSLASLQGSHSSHVSISSSGRSSLDSGFSSMHASPPAPSAGFSGYDSFQDNGIEAPMEIETTTPQDARKEKKKTSRFQFFKKDKKNTTSTQCWQDVGWQLEGPVFTLNLIKLWN